MNARILIVALGLTFGSVMPAAHAGFADPLDTPAVANSLSSQGLFNGLAWAGHRIVAVGQRGTILYSDDQGQIWVQALVPVQSDLVAVSFPDAQHGWAVGHDGVVLASTDSGKTWLKQLDGRSLGPLLVQYYATHRPQGWTDDQVARLQADAQRFASEGPDQPFLDVWFSDKQHGYIVGAFNLILHTDDGGHTWVPWLDRTDNPRAYHLYAIHQVAGTVYIVGEQGLLMKLNPATQYFQAIPLPYKGTLFGITGDDHAAIVYGLRGNAFRSIDDGITWSSITTGVQVSLTAATRSVDGDLVLVTQGGQILDSHDDGAKYTLIPLDQRIPAGAILSLDHNTILLAGPRGLHRVSLKAVEGQQP